MTVTKRAPGCEQRFHGQFFVNVADRGISIRTQRSYFMGIVNTVQEKLDKMLLAPVGFLDANNRIGDAAFNLGQVIRPSNGEGV